MRKAIILAALLCMAAPLASLHAQAPGAGMPAAPGEVRGVVVDAEGRQPVAAAAIEVWSHATRALVAGTIGRPDGMFRVDGLRPGRYALRVALIGYEPHRVEEFTIDAASPRVNLGTIELTRAVIALDAVEVNAESSVIVAPDRNVYRAREIAPAAATASDVLENVPSVALDADGKVSLRGNENVVIQINGRPAPLTGLQLAGYLRQLPAGTLERVEVIPNPSARHDPEGMAGIINIVLRQNVDLGRSAGLLLTGATSERYSASGNFGYQGGPITLMTNYGYVDDDRHINGVNDRTRLGAGRIPIAFTEQDIDGNNHNRGHNLTANLDYKLSQRNSLFTATVFNWRDADDASLAAYSELDGARELLRRYDRTRANDSRNRLADATVGFRRVIAPQRHELNTEVRVNRSTGREETALWRIFESTGTPDDGERSFLDTRAVSLTAQLDYTRPLGSTMKLETGWRSNWRWTDRDYHEQHDEDGTGTWVDSELSNALELDQGVHAIYGVLSRSSGRFELQGGLRGEYATRDFTTGDGEHFPHDYTSLFPSAVVSYKLNEQTQAKLSYSRRIRRPGTQELNPFPQFFDAQNVFYGNPQLDPEYTNAVELSLQRSGRLLSFQASPFYRHTTDVIRVDINTADTFGGREVTSITFRNLATSTSWGADFNPQLRAGRLNGLAALNVFKMVTDGGSESSLSSDAVAWGGRTNLSYVPRPGTTLQANYFFQAPMNFERGRFKGQSMLGLAVRQKLPNHNAFLTVRASDIFNTGYMRVEVGDDNIIQFTDRRFESRALHVSLQYSVGQAPRVRQRPQEEEAPSAAPFPR